MPFADFTLSKKEDAKYYSIDHEDPAIRAEMEGGYVITRARHTRAPRRTWTTGFTLITQADRATLENYWNTKKGGSDMFEWTDPTTNETHLVRFKQNLEFEYQGAGDTFLWGVKITLEEV